MEADEVLSRLRAGDLEPRNAARAALVHAQVLERLEDVPRLREALDAAIDRAALPGLDPEVPITAYARRGRLRLDEGDFAGAIADLSEARAWIAAAFGGTSPGVLIDLAIAHLNSGEPDLAAECGEQALRITSGSEDPHQTLMPRRILADAYQAAGSWGLALEQVRALQAIEPPERQPSLLEQEGDMLERTGQEREAVEKFLGAADGYGELGARVEEARCFRRAAESALWTDDPERAAELRGRAAALLDGLDEPEAVYHRAGLLLDEAVQHDYLGQPELGVPLLDRACDLFRSIGAEQAAQNCLLRRGEAGALPEEHVLREIHEQSREGRPFWRRSGYLLVTLLERDGRTAEAQDLQSRVQPGESWER
jgi:tetratricopeptide (TPR) repeat protein